MHEFQIVAQKKHRRRRIKTYFFLKIDTLMIKPLIKMGSLCLFPIIVTTGMSPTGDVLVTSFYAWENVLLSLLRDF